MFAADCEIAPQHGRKLFAHLHLIQGGKTKVVKAQIDSASTYNTMPSSLLNELFPDAKISKTRSKINTYGRETMRPKGQVTLFCDRKEKIHMIDFLVVDLPYNKPPLFCVKDAQALDYLKIYADETHTVEEKTPQTFAQLGKLTKEDVLEHYLKPGSGKPLGAPMHISLDPSISPVQAPTRWVPVAKLERVNEQLKRLCDEGIIRPITQPTDWLSNILERKTEWQTPYMH